MLWNIWLRLADFQIFSKLPQPLKHTLGAKFSKVRQLRDVFTINTPTLHVHAQSHSDSINTYFLVATDVLMQSLLKLLIVIFWEEDRGSLQPK